MGDLSARELTEVEDFMMRIHIEMCLHCDGEGEIHRVYKEKNFYVTKPCVVCMGTGQWLFSGEAQEMRENLLVPRHEGQLELSWPS